MAIEGGGSERKRRLNTTKKNQGEKSNKEGLEENSILKSKERREIKVEVERERERGGEIKSCKGG